MIIALWLVLTALAGPLRLPAAGGQGAPCVGRRIALLGGPAGCSADFAPLRYTDDDARALGSLLDDPAVGDFDRVIVLTQPHETTRPAVRAALEEITAVARSPDDMVFVYFSTHGTLSPDASGDLEQYLVLSDTRMADIPGTALSHAELWAWLEGLPSRRRLALLATCHSGRGKSAWAPAVRQELASRKGPDLDDLLRVSEAVMVIGVCAMDEVARESEALGHDIYTGFFLEALEKGDADGDGAVTATEAHGYARGRTFAFTDGAQRPYLRAEMLGGDPIVLSGTPRRAPLPSVVSYSAGLHGYGVRIDGETKGELPGQIVLGPGTHRVELVAPHTGTVVARRRLKLEDDASRVGLESLVRRDRVRVSGGLGGWSFGDERLGGIAVAGRIARPLRPPWEITGWGVATVRWPRPTGSAGLGLERALNPGSLQARAGLGLAGFLLLTPDDPELVAMSLTPVPSLALEWLPARRFIARPSARLGAASGWVWYADGGQLHGTAMLDVTLSVGLAL